MRSKHADANYDQLKWLMKPTSLLVITALCLFGFLLHSQSELYRESEAALQALQWILLLCLAVWCGTFLLLSFSRKDWSLISLLVVGVSAYFISRAEYRSALDAVAFFSGVTFGKGVSNVLKSGQRRTQFGNGGEPRSQEPEIRMFLIGLIFLLAFASWCHLNVARMFYPGTRWTGLWNDPNLYGMLMGAGVVLSVGLLGKQGIADRKLPIAKVFLLTAISMMGVGLVMSYSRGAWMGAAVGFLYLAWFYGKLKWRCVLPVVAVVAAVFFIFSNATPDSAPWYVKRLDLGRPSAQHRVAAWWAGLQMMWDHPFGVGWNNAVSLYQRDYSPPENGAAALATNDYLMLGAQLGWPGLICFVTYAGLCLCSPRRHLTPALSPSAPYPLRRCGEGELSDVTPRTVAPITCLVSPAASDEASLGVACRAGALSFLVVFWFDGGLFTLATASVFWILLELGVEPRTTSRPQPKKMEDGK